MLTSSSWQAMIQTTFNTLLWLQTHHFVCEHVPYLFCLHFRIKCKVEETNSLTMKTPPKSSPQQQTPAKTGLDQTSWKNLHDFMSHFSREFFKNMQQITRAAIRQQVSGFGLWCVQCIHVNSSRLMLQQRYTEAGRGEERFRKEATESTGKEEGNCVCVSVSVCVCVAGGTPSQVSLSLCFH